MKLFVNIIGYLAILAWVCLYYVLFTTYSDNVLIIAGLCLLITAVHSLLYKRYLNDQKWGA